MTGTFPSKKEVEKDLFGTSWFEGRKMVPVLVEVAFNAWLVFDFLISATNPGSCRSCAHG